MISCGWKTDRCGIVCGCKKLGTTMCANYFGETCNNYARHIDDDDTDDIHHGVQVVMKMKV